MRKDQIEDFYAQDLETAHQEKSPFIIFRSVRSERHEAMLGIIEAFPEKIHKDTAYARLTFELRELGYTFDRKLGKDQEAVSEARKKLGFGVLKPFWIRTKASNSVDLREEEET